MPDDSNGKRIPGKINETYAKLHALPRKAPLQQVQQNHPGRGNRYLHGGGFGRIMACRGFPQQAMKLLRLHRTIQQEGFVRKFYIQMRRAFAAILCVLQKGTTKFGWKISTKPRRCNGAV